MQINKQSVGIIELKFTGDMSFTCYGNVKGVIDNKGDKVIDGAFIKSIASRKMSGEMPIMFWNHEHDSIPVGVWVDMEEDEIGLKMTGKLNNSPRGIEIYQLLKSGGVKAFSMGFITVKSRHNATEGCRELLEVDVAEVSLVNFPCNEKSVVISVKNTMTEGNMPSKRELQDLLRESGLSKRQAERISDRYEPVDAWEELAKAFTLNK